MSHHQEPSGAPEVGIELDLNGSPRTMIVDPVQSLASAVRAEGLTGTKLGCETGDCGACAVLVDGVPMASCLLPAVRAGGRRVTTVEGLGTATELSPLQAAFMRHNASQCGYCIPGILVAASPLVDRDELTRDDVVSELTGNLCRCTGYESIVDAVLDAHQQVRSGRTGGAA
ncbi:MULTISPECIES: (2Fe-2S)-binding protein [Nocardioides]|uniref:Carbon-monoxide dehydrogenase small subunit n=1 Tax=Nocardioides soli TaxID=1036020 RepID=A0A7W4VU01_9ACTN|nr:(2Fe-2S)-binding protein [Nocardioides sp. LMS-CY]MBB3041766.1 carbon-monoxide dehydrogenase small subunit [Nocardioides soli]